jgi:hypothetical protein
MPEILAEPASLFTSLQIDAVNFDRATIAGHANNLAKTIQGNLKRSMEAIGVVCGTCYYACIETRQCFNKFSTISPHLYLFVAFICRTSCWAWASSKVPTRCRMPCLDVLTWAVLSPQKTSSSPPALCLSCPLVSQLMGRQVRVFSPASNCSWFCNCSFIAVSSIAVFHPCSAPSAAVFTSDHALKMEWIPQWVAIIGSGYIGLEFSDVYTALGSEVTFIEALPNIMPGFDREIAKLAQRLLINTRSIDFHTNVLATKVTPGTQQSSKAPLHRCIFLNEMTPALVTLL